MYDSVTASDIPGAPSGLVACYIDGRYTNETAVRARFPSARLVTIAINAATTGADVYDRENGDILTSQVPQILARERAGGRNPTIYVDASMWSNVVSVVRKAGIPQPPYWVADYDGDAIIPAGAVAKQYANNKTFNYDMSVVADYWPGIDPDPATPIPTPAPATAPEDTMLIADVDRLTVPKGTDWPGDFLLGSNGQVRHIVSTADLRAFQGAGLKTVTISYQQYQLLVG
jgi:hypothetical protein